MIEKVNLNEKFDLFHEQVIGIERRNSKEFGNFVAGAQAADGERVRQNGEREHLNALELSHSALVLHIAGIERRFGFEQHHVRFLAGNRQMLDALGNDRELAFIQVKILIPQPDA